MAKRVKKRSEKQGLPPGSLVHVGKEATSPLRMTLFDYNETVLEEHEITTVQEALRCKESSTISWINVEGISDSVLIGDLCNQYGIHPLVIEDILNTSIRPKYEHHSEYLVIILKMLVPCKNDRATCEHEKFITEQVSFVLGKGWLLTFQENSAGDVFGRVRDRLRTPQNRLRTSGADYLCYALLDAVVDGYFLVLEALGEGIEQLELAITEGRAETSLGEIHGIRRFALSLRRSVWPVRDIISSIDREGSTFINQNTHIFLRDVYDHSVEVMDMLESFREMVAGLMELYLSFVSHRMNSVMMVLTVVTVIFMPLTFLVGVYGMNFEFMPELHWKYGYPLVWSIMISIAVSMALFFKRRKWL